MEILKNTNVDIIRALGIEWLLDGEVQNRLDGEILSQTRFLVPGYKYNYRLRTFSGDLEFQRCETLGGEGVGIDMHFSADQYFEAEIVRELDGKPTAPSYIIRTNGGAELPARLLCPDVLPEIREGTRVHSQGVIFAESVKRIPNKELEERLTATPLDGGTVEFTGRISNASYTSFCFDGRDADFWELTAKWEGGNITVLVSFDNIDFNPDEHPAFRGVGYLSMDVGVEDEFIPDKKRLHQYDGILPDADGEKYTVGFLPLLTRTQRVFELDVEKGEICRFLRCCRPNVELIADGESVTVESGELPDRLRGLLPSEEYEIKWYHVLSCRDEKYVGYVAWEIRCGGKPRAAVSFDTDRYGMVNGIAFFGEGEYELGVDEELHLQRMISLGLADGKPLLMKEFLSPSCIYRSEYAEMWMMGADTIVSRLRRIDGKLDKMEKRYSFRHALTSEELITADGVEPIYGGKRCAVYRFSGELAYITFINYGENGLITEILLSRDSRRLKAFVGVPTESDKVPYVPPRFSARLSLMEVYGEADTVSEMRRGELPPKDKKGVYIWKKTDEFALSFLEEKGYGVTKTEIFDCCIGYAAHRKGREYAFFFFAFSHMTDALPGAEDCLWLRDTELARGRDTLTVNVCVERTENETGETEYRVIGHGAKEEIIEIYLLEKLGERDILRYYPCPETDEGVQRLIYAYNSADYDAMRSICTNDFEITSPDVYRVYGDEAFTLLSDYRRRYGMMKKAYFSFNSRDKHLSKVGYIHGFAYVGFNINKDGLITLIEFHSLECELGEMLVKDEVGISPFADYEPRAVGFEPLPQSADSRYAMRVDFDNGESRLYRFNDSKGGGEIGRFGDFIMTEKILANARLREALPLSSELDGCDYVPRGQGIEFITGASVSAREIYFKGERISSDGQTPSG